MFFWDQIDRPNHYSAVQGRFTLEVNINAYDNEMGHNFDISGGFWVNTNILSSFSGWNGDVHVFLKYKNDHMSWPRRVHTSVANGQITYSSAPSRVLFGDGPEFTQGRTWLPMIHTRLWLQEIEILDILTGKADIILEAERWVGRINGGNAWSILFHQALTINRPSDAQLVITASKDIPQMIISELKYWGHVWIGHDDITKNEFDAFWTSLFSQHGNDTPQAKRASVLAWVSRPSFVDEPRWQAFLCLVILANVSYPNSDLVHHHDSGLVLASRLRQIDPLIWITFLPETVQQDLLTIVRNRSYASKPK